MCPYKDPEIRRVYHKEYNKRDYEENKLRILSRQKQRRLKDPQGAKEYRRQYYSEHRQELLAYNKERYHKCQEERERRIVETFARRHLSLDSKCEICGSNENLERHHPDYSKPLEIMTLCRNCHYTIHSD